MLWNSAGSALGPFSLTPALLSLNQYKVQNYT